MTSILRSGKKIYCKTTKKKKKLKKLEGFTLHTKEGLSFIPCRMASSLRRGRGKKSLQDYQKKKSITQRFYAAYQTRPEFYSMSNGFHFTQRKKYHHKTKKKKKVKNSKVLRCVQNKARVLLHVEWLSVYAAEKKKKITSYQKKKPSQ